MESALCKGYKKFVATVKKRLKKSKIFADSEIDFIIGIMLKYRWLLVCLKKPQEPLYELFRHTLEGWGK